MYRASDLRSNPLRAPSGIMSGSQNRLNRNGSTASGESGPPSWKQTMATRLDMTVEVQFKNTRDSLPALIGLPSFKILLKSFDLRAQIRNASRNRKLIHHQNSPNKHVRHYNTAKVIHLAPPSLRYSDSTCNSSTVCRSDCNLYLCRIIITIIAASAMNDRRNALYMSPFNLPALKMIGGGCCVRHHQIEKYTSGTSRNANAPKTAEITARLSGLSTSPRKSG